MDSVLGHCKYCGSPRMVQVQSDTLDKEEYDKIATWECDCQVAREVHDKEVESQQIKTNIGTIIRPVNNMVADAMIECIGILQEGAAKKVTIGTDYGVTYKMMKTQKGVKVSMTTSETKEIDT